MQCPNIEKNLQDCGCTYTSCKRRGNCCQCVRHHRAQGEIPGCFFTPEVERTYDRSIANFIKTRRS